MMMRQMRLLTKYMFMGLLCLHLILPGRAQAFTISGTPEFVKQAHEIIAVYFETYPAAAVSLGIMEQASRLPSFTLEKTRILGARLTKARAALSHLPWSSWDIDRQIDYHWLLNRAQLIERDLLIEQSYRHRPAEWLSPVAATMLSLINYAPQRLDIQEKLARGIPDLVNEMKLLCRQPTQHDVKLADEIITALQSLFAAHPEAQKSLQDYQEFLKTLQPLQPYHVIGKKNYAWRLKHALLLPWTVEQLVAMAKTELLELDSALKTLEPLIESLPPISADEKLYAKELTESSYLKLYQDIIANQERILKNSNLISAPKGLLTMRVRPTPAVFIPLTGKGGSMSAPPMFSDQPWSYWNVRAFDPHLSIRDRENLVLELRHSEFTSLGPYSAHEAYPGHHWHLTSIRNQTNPIRKIFFDPSFVEGWGVYAEELMWRMGGFGASKSAHYHMLNSWRGRVRRVIFDANIETGRWTLQEGANWKQGSKSASIDAEILRTLNNPTQLITYFAGKKQILELKQACQKKWADKYSEKRFHDELLAVGAIPLSYARFKLLGELIPPYPPLKKGGNKKQPPP